MENYKNVFAPLLILCLPTRDGTIHLPPDSILSRYLGADTICIAICFKNYDSKSIAIRYSDVLRFSVVVFNSRPWEKVEYSLNIQTVTIKKNN